MTLYKWNHAIFIIFETPLASPFHQIFWYKGFTLVIQIIVSPLPSKVVTTLYVLETLKISIKQGFTVLCHAWHVKQVKASPPALDVIQDKSENKIVLLFLIFLIFYFKKPLKIILYKNWFMLHSYQLFFQLF